MGKVKSKYVVIKPPRRDKYFRIGVREGLGYACRINWDYVVEKMLINRIGVKLYKEAEKKELLKHKVKLFRVGDKNLDKKLSSMESGFYTGLFSELRRMLG